MRNKQKQAKKVLAQSQGIVTVPHLHLRLEVPHKN